MDFFAHQEKARRRSSLLIVLFSLAVALIIAAVYLVMLLILQPPLHPDATSFPAAPTDWRQYWNGELFGWTATLTVLLISAGSLYKISSLSSGGGSAIARSLGGVLVGADTTRPKERQLLNVVEEMALAAGISPPRVFLIDSPSVNAFAAGNSINSAVIGVTRGCIKRLSRQELQGVIAHEFSHIMNGDMVTNLRLVGLLHGILLLAIVGRILLRATARSSGGRNSGQARALFFAVGISLVVIGSIGVLFGRIIKAAVSRQREFLADATAVQYTRDPEGIYGALKKIAALSEGGKIDEPVAEEVAHLFFADALRTASSSWFSPQLFSALFSTHPPLKERMSRILPKSQPGRGKVAQTIPEKPSPPEVTSPSHPRIPVLPGVSLLGDLEVGQLDRLHLDSAETWMSSLPPALEESLRTPEGSAAALLGLLMSTLPPPTRRAARLRMGEVPSAVWDRASTLSPALDQVSTSSTLPLIDLCLPALRELPPSDLKAVHRHLQVLADLQGEESLLSYMLNAFVRARLGYSPSPSAGFNPSSSTYLPMVRAVLSTLARHGHPSDSAAAQAAFARAMVRFAEILRPSKSAVGYGKTLLPARFLEILDQSQCDQHRFDHALFSLQPAPPAFKEALLASCAESVFKDGVISDSEHQLMRAVAGVLDCPIPPSMAAFPAPANK